MNFKHIHYTAEKRLYNGYFIKSDKEEEEEENEKNCRFNPWVQG